MSVHRYKQSVRAWQRVVGLRAPTEDHGPAFMPANKCALYLILLSLHLSDISSLFICEVIWICMLMNAASRRSLTCRQPKEPKSLHLCISSFVPVQVLHRLWISLGASPSKSPSRSSISSTVWSTNDSPIVIGQCSASVRI
jgi:hypothetical protein